MSQHPDPPIPSTTGSVRAGSASRDVGDPPAEGRRTGRPAGCRGLRETFALGRGVERGAAGRPHERTPREPLYRPLRIYTVDPGTRQDEGATAVVNVPYEPLPCEPGKGILGSVFHVLPVRKKFEDDDGPVETHDIDLNDPFHLLTDGRAPSPVDPRFHQQMVYAIASLVYASFRRALGRNPTWGFDPHPEHHGHARLRLSPHGNSSSAGAAYDRDTGEVTFGFVKIEGEVRGRGAPNGHTFSCVSHDIVTHEVTHALLDGLRTHFLDPTSPDVLGFHEGFADVITLLHHFSYTEVVRSAVRRSRGNVLQSALLTSIAIEFGLTTGNGGALRSLAQARARARAAAHGRRGLPRFRRGQALDAPGEDHVLPRYDPDMEAHAMGEVFTSAVFHAFASVYTRKAERYLRLSTGGTGVLPLGDIPPDLQDVLAEEASQLASQFLNVCIRAIDYCPPVDLQLGEFLRAVITADLDLVPDDRWGYREAWIDAFARHGIRPAGVQSMSEDELRWDFISDDKLVVKDLAFTRLSFNGDPACPANPEELRRRACALGRFVARNPETFGLVREGHELLNGDTVTLPEVQSVRSSRRVGPDGQVIFDLVAEVTQTRTVVDDGYKFLFRGGSTIIIGPHGEVRYVIAKSVIENGRVFRQQQFMQGPGAVHATLRPDGWEADAAKAHFTYPHP
ncbi:MAG TPA: hypothetical protein VGB15_16760 [Longimicrobium sp.]|jgi:hypothetical protein